MLCAVGNSGSISSLRRCMYTNWLSASTCVSVCMKVTVKFHDCKRKDACFCNMWSLSSVMWQVSFCSYFRCVVGKLSVELLCIPWDVGQFGVGLVNSQMIVLLCGLWVLHPMFCYTHFLKCCLYVAGGQHKEERSQQGRWVLWSDISVNPVAHENGK